MRRWIEKILGLLLFEKGGLTHETGLREGEIAVMINQKIYHAFAACERCGNYTVYVDGDYFVCDSCGRKQPNGRVL